MQQQGDHHEEETETGGSVSIAEIVANYFTGKSGRIERWAYLILCIMAALIGAGAGVTKSADAAAIAIIKNPSLVHSHQLYVKARATHSLPGLHLRGSHKTAASAMAFCENSTQEVIDAEARFLVNTYARVPVVFVRGEGCRLYDVEGKEYLDFAGGIAVNVLGHGDPLWVKAVSEQAANLAHVSNVYHSVPQVKLAERLVHSAPFADRVFFSNSGTEANEAAIKFARKYQQTKAAEKNSAEVGGAATEFVAFENCFHGRTIGALALTSKQNYRTPFEPLMPGVQFVEFGNLEAVTKAVRPGHTAAVFVEPVQGEGGIYPASTDFIQGLREVCDAAGALLVFDEVQCGLGRTGHFWAHEAYGVQPDILTVAKPLAGGLPIGAVLVTNAVAKTIVPGDHGSTFAGGPLVCTAALAVLDHIQDPGFLEKVVVKGYTLLDLLTRRLSSNNHVKEVRGSGLLVGIELDVSASPLVAAARSAGLIVLTAGNGNIVRLAPPLVITEIEIEKAVDILSDCIKIFG